MIIDKLKNKSIDKIEKSETAVKINQSELEKGI